MEAEVKSKSVETRNKSQHCREEKLTPTWEPSLDCSEVTWFGSECWRENLCQILPKLTLTMCK